MSNCISCGSPLRPNAKFCTYCGTKQEGFSQTKEAVTTPPPEVVPSVNDAVSLVKQKIVWNIQPGEIARSIKERDFEQYDSAQGVVVSENTTAYIRVNGKAVAEIGGGNYNFLSTYEIERELASREGNKILNALKNAGRFIIKLFQSKKANEEEKAAKNEEQLQHYNKVVEHLKRGSLFAIELKRNGDFQLLFGEGHEQLDDYANFSPMTIQTKYVDISIGIRALFRIADFNAFSTYYLTDREVVRTNTLANELTPIVRSILVRHLRDVEIDDNRIPEAVYANIKSELVNLDFHGIVLSDIVEITTKNEDLDRFRSLSRELYLSEKELDYFHRTNDFKNRLSLAVNAQKIYKEQSDLDLFKSLEAINKDKALSEDELERFYILLSRERRIFEAQDDEIAKKALAEIEKTGLLRDEEIKLIEFQIHERDHQRGFALELTKLQDASLYEQTRFAGQQKIEKQAVAHEIEKRQMVDAYENEVAMRSRQMERLQKGDAREEMEFLQRMADQGRSKQLEALKEIQHLEAEMGDRETDRLIREKQQDYEFLLKQQQEEAQTAREAAKLQAEMTPEQLLAQQMKDMSEAAQAEYARSFSAGKDADKERETREEMMKLMKEQAERDLQVHQSSSADMKEMMKDMMATLGAMSGNMVQNKNEQKEEYRNQLHREQDRHDKHQDKALNYTTRPQQAISNPPRVNPTPANPQPYSPPPVTVKECVYCKATNDIASKFCDSCGNEL